jgi:hypothetical protein
VAVSPSRERRRDRCHSPRAPEVRETGHAPLRSHPRNHRRVGRRDRVPAHHPRRGLPRRHGVPELARARGHRPHGGWIQRPAPSARSLEAVSPLHDLLGRPDAGRRVHGDGHGDGSGDERGTLDLRHRRRPAGRRDPDLGRPARRRDVRHPADERPHTLHQSVDAAARLRLRREEDPRERSGGRSAGPRTAPAGGAGRRVVAAAPDAGFGRSARGLPGGDGLREDAPFDPALRGSADRGSGERGAGRAEPPGDAVSLGDVLRRNAPDGADLRAQSDEGVRRIRRGGSARSGSRWKRPSPGSPTRCG